jgi:hypothetical protein
MRKPVYTILSAAIVIVASASIASGATAVKCGHLYQPHCTNPVVSGLTVSPGCHHPGSVFHLPALTVKAVAGLKRVTITVHSTGRTILAINLHGVRTKRISGVTFSTKGLKSGAHVITIRVVDVRGKVSTKLLPFAICRPKPMTTG